MKHKLLILSSFFLSILSPSCKKDKYDFKGTSSIYVINATLDAAAIKINPGAGSDFSYAKSVNLASGASNVFGSFVGSKKISVVSASDTTKIYFERYIMLEPVNTLYLTGQIPNIDTLFNSERLIPYIQSVVSSPDNSMYLRFVNLSPNSTSLKVNIRLSTDNEVTRLNYKDISNFIKYAALPTTPNYIFEIRDVATNSLQATFTLNTNANRFKTMSLIIKGLLGVSTGPNAFGVFLVSYT